MMKKKVLAMFLVCIMVLMAACSAHNEQQTEQQSEQQATAQSNEDLEETSLAENKIIVKRHRVIVGRLWEVGKEAPQRHCHAKHRKAASRIERKAMPP